MKNHNHLINSNCTNTDPRSYSLRQRKSNALQKIVNSLSFYDPDDFDDFSEIEDIMLGTKFLSRL